MPTFSEVYAQEQQSFIDKLNQITIMSELLDSLKYINHKLLDTCRPDLTKPQLSVAISCFNILELTLDTFSDVQSQRLVQEVYETQSTTALRAIPPELIGCALGGAVIGTAIGGLIGVVFGTLLGVVTGKGVSLLLESKHLSDRASEVKNKPLQVIPIISDAVVFAQKWGEIYAITDEAIATYGVTYQPPKPSLENHSDVLELFQNLLGESQSREAQLDPIILGRIKEIRTLLRSSDIEVHTFLPTQEVDDSIRSMFEIEPSIDPDLKSYKCLLPALVKGNQILLMGRIIEPIVRE